MKKRLLRFLLLLCLTAALLPAAGAAEGQTVALKLDSPSQGVCQDGHGGEQAQRHRRFFRYCGVLSPLGITGDNKMYYGHPSVFYRVKTIDGGTAYNINVFDQSPDASVIYTPARGGSIPVTGDGAVLTVKNGVTTGY